MLRNALTFKHVEHDPEGESRILLFNTLFPNEPIENLHKRWLSLSLRKDHLTSQQLDTFKSFIMRRCQYEPIEYITGRVNFFGRQFQVNKHVLIPRVDSEVMIEAVMKRMNEFLKESSSSPTLHQDGINIVELGVGSGCLILTLLLELEKANIKVNRAIGLDKSSEALQITSLNAQLLLPAHLRNKLILKEHDMLHDEFNPEEWLSDDSKLLRTNTSNKHTNIHDDSKTTYSFTHLLISNPPYIPSQVVLEELDKDVSLYEPHLALDGGQDGLMFYRFLLSEETMEKYRFHPSSLMALELGFDQAPVIMKQILGNHWRNIPNTTEALDAKDYMFESKSGSNFKVELEKDLNNFDRILLVMTQERTEL
ncbi:hypothetical protein C9374_002762 [Naegleria lovaniensis]|uniref:Release factor glutamine methyltransferase N-terminal domain-containing protein n=1 Tax=Naegleria lovaniensis TaxID=51637 RepID=A0AA88GV04_NAELO|nr:uncharacterized protein C9374_002762 [Naegleria lovaniensis]KAG2386316.1 hypothetical protein C9374_002762 [Naegleria lovaniensis]